MAGYQFRASGLRITGFDGQGIDTFFEGELFDAAQAVIEKIAVATGNSKDLDPGKIQGVFAICIAKDRDGNKCVGLQPLNPINADLINAGE